MSNGYDVMAGNSRVYSENEISPEAREEALMYVKESRESIERILAVAKKTKQPRLADLALK